MISQMITPPIDERRGHGKRPGDLAVHRHLVLVVEPEAAVQQPVEVVPVLVPESVLESQAYVRGVDRQRPGGVAGEPRRQVCPVAREEDHIGDERDDEHHEHQVDKSLDDELRHRHLPSPHLRAALAWVESVAEPVTEQVEREGREEQRHAREDEEPPGDRVEVTGLRLCDHVAP